MNSRAVFIGLLTLAVACAAVSASAATLYWDGGTTNIIAAGDGASAGGSGTWNTTLQNWDQGTGLAHVAWVNASSNTAVFGGTGGTVTLGEAITVRNITFNGAGNYTLSGNTLNFVAGGAITQDVPTANHTITAGITGSPSVALRGGSSSTGTAFAPTSATQTLGAVTLCFDGANNIILTLGGTTTGNSVGAIVKSNNYAYVVKDGAGTWTVGNIDAGQIAINAGNLIATGTLKAIAYSTLNLNGGVLHYNNAGGAWTDAAHPFTFAGGNLDNSSGAPITTSTYNPPMAWNANFTFLGSRGTNSDLFLGTGAVTMNASRTVTINSNATLTVGGVIAGAGFGLTKAGTGTLKLTGTNTFTGPVTVNAGTLTLGQVRALPFLLTVTVNTGAVLRLDFADALVVSNLVLNGVSQAAGYYDSTNAAPFIAGAGSVLVPGPAPDTDGDGIPDWWLIVYFGHANGAAGDLSRATDDADGDGLTNLQEYQAGTNPKIADTDGDGLSDGDEVNTYHTNPLLADTDGDGLSDGAEVNTYHTNPLLADTDGDGVGDWYEVVAAYTSPTNSASKPNIPYPLPRPTGAKGATNKPVKVFILSGQSNMVGMGEKDPLNTPGTLSTIVKQQGKFPNYVDANGNWSVWSNVYYRGVISAIGNGPLTAGFGASSSKIGPELGFGAVMGYYLNEPVLLIKSSIGNRSLLWDCLPPGSPRFDYNGNTYAGYGDSPNSWPTNGAPSPFVWYAGKQYDDYFLAENDMGPTNWLTGTTYPSGCQVRNRGTTYDCISNHTAAAISEPGVGASWSTYWNVHSIFNVVDILDNWAAQYPQWATQGFEIAGFVWFQGNKDMSDPAASRYETNLVRFIKQLRTYYANRYPGKCNPTAPFVIATGCGDPQTNGYGLVVANAQLAMNNAAKYPEFAGNVRTMDTRGYWRDVSISPTTAGYHYYGNAETFALVGDALGRGMIDLLSAIDSNPPVISALSPANNATGVVVDANLVAFFNKPIIAGSGNITLLNLTDATQTTIPITDAAQVAISGSTLTINPTSNLLTGRQYAVHIAPTAISDLATNYFAGITNNTTWNFTTVQDPLLSAVGDLKNHILGTTNLTAAQIDACKLTIDANTNRFAESAATISNIFELVRTYDAVKGPLWVVHPAFTRSTQTNDLDWTIYWVMQYIMDRIYNTATLTNYTALLNGFMFGSASNFPGPCAAPAPTNTYTVAVNASFPQTFGRDTQDWTTPARRPTGAYLAPGTIVRVVVPASLVGKGYQVRVGAHSWDFSNKPTVARLDRSSLLYDINAVTNLVASPLGGGIYIEVPMGATGGVVNVTTIGAARAPFYQATSFHQTTSNEWVTTERTNPGPWADYQTDKFMCQVPRSWMYNTAYPAAVMSDWDKAMDACNDLMGFPQIRGKETMYYQVDLFLRASVYAPGYPTVNLTYNPKTDYGGNVNNYLLTGPQYAAQYVFHEQGHSYFFPKFSGETEAEVNLLHVPVQNRKFGVSLDDAFRGSYDYIGNNVTNNLDNTAVLWMTSFSFSPLNRAMQDWEKAYQPQGHAKFVDIARLYGENGWAGLGNYWYYYNSNDTYGVSVPKDNDSLLLQLCKSVGQDVRPLFHFWGIIPQNPTNLAAQVAAAGLRPPAAIRDLLMHYKSLVPTNNAAYQSWCLKWYGRQPTMSGYGVEREHARQWDTNVLVSAADQVRFPTEIFDEAAFTQVTARVQEIVDLYYPAGNTYLINLPATGLASNAAVLNATLGCSGNNPAVCAYWGTVNGGTNVALWSAAAAVGSWTNEVATNITFTATGLAANTPYYFTFRATNSYTDVWATNVLTFTTLGANNVPSTTTLTSSLGSAGGYGQTVIFTATVTVPTNGPATGTVTFKEGATTLGTATLSGGQAAWTNNTLTAGEHALTAGYSGSSEFAPSASVPLAYTVVPKTVTITGVTAANKTYDATTVAALTGGTVSGVVNGDVVTVVPGTGAFASANVGTWPVTASGYALGGAGAGNYVLAAQPNPGSATISPLAVTITGVTATNKVYDGTTAAILSGGTVAGVLSGDEVTVVPGTGAFASANVGTWPVTATNFTLGGAAAGNYTLSAQPNPGTATITARPVQLTGARVYDATATAAATNLTILNNVDGTNLTLAGSATLASKNFGMQAVVFTNNIPMPVRLQSATGSATTTATYNVTLAATPANGNTLIAVTATRGTSTNQVTGIGQTNAKWTRVVQAANSSGVTIEIWSAPNVTNAGTTVTITNASALRAAAVVIEYSGLLATGAVDKTSSATGTSTAAVTGTTPTTTQDRELWLGGIGIADGRRTLNAPYGNNFVAVTNVLSGSTSSDAMIYALETITNTTGAASSSGTVSSSDSWAGAIATFRAASPAAPTLTLTGAAAGNYTLTGATGTVTITTKPLLVTGLTASNKVYDGTTVAPLSGTAALLTAEAPGSGTTSDGRPYTGDAVSLSGTATGAFADKHAAPNKTVTLNGLSLSGAQAPNYSLLTTNLTATISSLSVTVTAVTATKTYDGTTSAPGTPTITPPLAAGDTTTVLSQSFQDPNAGISNKVVVPHIVINDGNGGANYTVTPQNYLTGTINPAPVTVQLSDLTVTYDGTPKNVTVTTTPSNVAVSVTYNGSPTAPTTAGSYAVVATIPDPNYQGGASGTLTINPASQTISFGPLPARAVGDPPFALTATASSGLPVSYTSSDPGVAAVNGSNVTVLASGVTTITASQPGNTNYTAAAPVAQTLTVLLAAPTGLTALVTNGTVELNWNVSAGAVSYNVKRGTIAGGPYATIGTATGTNYTDGTLLDGVTYYYVVSAVNGIGESGNSLPVNAALSANADLTSLVPSAGTLSPAFVSNTFSYTASVPYATSFITVTPTTHDPSATITVNGTPVVSGSPSGPISLSVGSNTVTTVVVAQDLSLTNTYTLTVTRAAGSTNAYLVNLVPSAGTLSPAFASNTFNYAATVFYGIASLTVTPTAADTTATITVNGSPVASGSASENISLNFGSNTVTTVVVSEDLSATNTYVLTVTRTPQPRTVYWDGGSTDIGTDGNSASAGGTGTWDTTIKNWDVGTAPHTNWNNANNDIAFFGGTAGTVTNQGVTVGGLIFTTANYVITNSTVTFATAGSISNSAAVTIASAMAGTGPITKEGAGALTLSGTNTFNGITLAAAAGAVTISGNTLLGAAQTWLNNSASALTVSGAINNNGNTLTIDGSGPTMITSNLFGTGGLIKNGSGVLQMRVSASTHAYTGPTVINGGVVMLGGTHSAGNYTLNGAMLTDYYHATTTFASGLGAGNNQIQIYGDSGFGGGNGNSTWSIGASGSILQWGSTYFNPTTLKFLVPGADNMGPSIYGQVTLDNGLDLNGGSRTVSVAQATGPAALYSSWGKISGSITNTAGTAAGLVKIGGGNLLLTGNNSYDGGTTINQGAMRFDSLNAMPATGNVQVNNGAILGIKLGGAGSWTNLTSGVGSLGGLLAGVGGRGASTVSYSGNVGLMLDVAANTTYSGDIADVGTTLAVYKIGASTLTLSGNNTYSGGTHLLQGTIIGDSATAISSSGNITFNGGTLQFTANSTAVNWGSAIKNSASAITLNTGGQTVTLTGNIDNSNVAGLTKAGTGTLVLTGTNTYGGATTVSVGTLVVNGGMISNNAAVSVTGGNTTMIITNGGKVFSGGAASSIGYNTSTNTMLVVGGSGVTTLWNLGNQDLQTWQTGPVFNNKLVIDGAGVAGSAVVTNVNNLVWGRSSRDSSILLTNGARMFVNGEVRIGNTYYASAATNNTLMIVGGAADSVFYGSTNNSFIVSYGERPDTRLNQVIVGAGGVLTNAGFNTSDPAKDFMVGYVFTGTGTGTTYSNRLVVTDGGKVFARRNLTVGYQSGNGSHALGDAVVIANGGMVNVPGIINIGYATVANHTSSYNSVSVTSGGMLTSSGLTIGAGVGITSNNYLLVDGGSVFAGTVTVTRASNYVALNAGTLRVAGSTVYSNGTDFVVGDGARAATLFLNGGTHRFQGGLRVANGSTLGGTGTVLTVTGTTILSGGILAPGNSVGTLTITGGDLVLSNGAVLNFELGTSSDLVACSNLTLAGTLNVTDAGGFGPGTNTLFTYIGALTDNGITVNNPLPGGYTGTINTDTPGQVRLIVTSGGSPPVASFTPSATSGVAPLTVNFTDTSTGAPTHWYWDFGDGGTSTNQHPAHTYAAGTWPASLIASNAAGASSPATAIITVITPRQSWENHYGLAADANDADGDGLSNWAEFLTGFNPTNPAAYLHVISVTRSNDDLNIVYLGANGDTSYPGGPAVGTNLLEYTAALTNNFISAGQTNILSGGMGTGIVTNFFVPGGAAFSPSRYYRVRVVTP